MGSGARFPRHLVLAECRQLLASLSQNVVVCGSLRRLESSCGDIDLVQPAGGDAIGRLLDLGLDLVERGEPRTQLALSVPWIRDGRLPVDVWTALPDRLGACVLHATGSGLHNVIMRRFAESQGLTVNYAGVTDRRGRLLAAQTESDCFSAVGWPERPPHLRHPDEEMLALVEHLP